MPRSPSVVLTAAERRTKITTLKGEINKLKADNREVGKQAKAAQKEALTKVKALTKQSSEISKAEARLTKELGKLAPPKPAAVQAAA